MYAVMLMELNWQQLHKMKEKQENVFQFGV